MGPTLPGQTGRIKFDCDKDHCCPGSVSGSLGSEDLPDVALVYAILGYGNHRNHQIFEKRSAMISNIFMGMGLFLCLSEPLRFEVSGCLYAPPCQFKVWNYLG